MGLAAQRSASCQKLSSPKMNSGLAKSKTRRFFCVDRRDVKALRRQRGLVKAPELPGPDQPQRLRSVLTTHVGDLGSDQKAGQPRRAIAALLEAEKLRGAQPEQ